MINTATFLGYLILGYLIAYLVGYSINGIISLIKNVR